jgi:hypothetical protein
LAALLEQTFDESSSVIKRLVAEPVTLLASRRESTLERVTRRIELSPVGTIAGPS